MGDSDGKLRKINKQAELLAINCSDLFVIVLNSPVKVLIILFIQFRKDYCNNFS